MLHINIKGVPTPKQSWLPGIADTYVYIVSLARRRYAETLLCNRITILLACDQTSMSACMICVLFCKHSPPRPKANDTTTT